MRVLAALLASIALASCGGQDTQPKQTDGAGQVLSGSVSDAMLPYDTASSAPPLEPRSYSDEGLQEATRSQGTNAKAADAPETAPESVPT